MENTDRLDCLDYSFDYVKTNCDRLFGELDMLGRKVGRHIDLVAVTKSGTDGEVLALAKHLAKYGRVHIGENRPQMLRARAELLRGAGIDAAFHEIGNLQKNKVRTIVGDVELIHSVDSLALAEEIGRRAEAVGRCIPILIEINSAREECKGGITPDEALGLYDELTNIRGITVSGLMTMGPATHDGEQLRPYFRATKELYDRLNEHRPFDGGILSMGMSDSYAVAIEEGATMVRVGSLLFKK